MTFIQCNSLRIEGNNNNVIQDADGKHQKFINDAFIKNITEEKDRRIADLERTIEDKVKIENYADAEIQRLGRELTQLKAERDFQKQRIEELLREFDGKDLSHTSKLYQNAFALFLAGDLDKTLEVLDEDKLLQQEAQTQAIRQQQAETRMLKAQMLEIQLDFAGAAHNYEKATEIYPSWKYHGEMANFYFRQKDYQKVEEYYQQSLYYANNDSERATTLYNLGNYYYANQKMPQAEEAYNETLKIYSQLAQKNPDTFLGNVATTLNGLGNYYSDNQKMPQAEKAYTEALKINRQLAQKDFDAFLPAVAMDLNNIGTYYYDNQKMPQAEKAYSKALKIRRQLADKNPDAFLPYVATTLNNLGVLYSDNQKMPQAEAAYTEALKINRQLSGKNPDAFLPYVANTLNNLVALYLDKPDKALVYLTECLFLRRALAEVSFSSQGLELARTLMVGGMVYEALQNEIQSQAFFKEALSIAEGFKHVPFAQQIIQDAQERIKK